VALPPPIRQVLLPEMQVLPQGMPLTHRFCAIAEDTASTVRHIAATTDFVMLSVPRVGYSKWDFQYAHEVRHSHAAPILGAPALAKTRSLARVGRP
jgi:hypothetical protein